MEWSCHLSAQLLRRTSLRSFSHNKINLSENRCAHTFSCHREMEAQLSVSFRFPKSRRALGCGLPGPTVATFPADRQLPGRSRNVNNKARKTAPGTRQMKLLVFPWLLFCSQGNDIFNISPVLFFMVVYTSLTLNLMFSNHPEAIKRNVHSTLIGMKGVPLNCTAELLIQFFKSFRR